MDRIKNIMKWQNDEELQSSIKHYVMQNMKRSEVLDFLKRDYPEYAWSLPTLDRRIKYFDMKYINYETTVDEVVAAISTENDGPGQLLSYGAMHKKIFVNTMCPQFLVVWYTTSSRCLRGCNVGRM